MIALGTNTDPYQPVEKTRRITRGLLEVFAASNHPLGIVTKSALVARDLDLLAPMAAKNLVQVCLSVTTLDRGLARRMEPRAATPERRLATIRRLSEAGIPTGVMVAPVIPALTDSEMEAILEAAADAGAETAGYVFLRLPLEIKHLFREWLDVHAPLKAARVMGHIRGARGGRDYDPTFHRRQRGDGAYADMLARRFQLATKRLGLNRERMKLDTSPLPPAAPVGRPTDPALNVTRAGEPWWGAVISPPGSAR